VTCSRAPLSESMTWGLSSSLLVSRRALSGENHRGLEAAVTTAYCRPNGKVERQSRTFPAPRDSPPPRERAADPPAPPSAADRRPPLVFPIRSGDTINLLHPTVSGAEGGGQRSRSPEPTHGASCGPPRNDGGPDQPSGRAEPVRDAGRDGGPHFTRETRSDEGNRDCRATSKDRRDVRGVAQEAVTMVATDSPPHTF